MGEDREGEDREDKSSEVIGEDVLKCWICGRQFISNKRVNKKKQSLIFEKYDHFTDEETDEEIVDMSICDVCDGILDFYTYRYINALLDMFGDFTYRYINALLDMFGDFNTEFGAVISMLATVHEFIEESLNLKYYKEYLSDHYEY